MGGLPDKNEFWKKHDKNTTGQAAAQAKKKHDGIYVKGILLLASGYREDSINKIHAIFNGLKRIFRLRQKC